MTHEVSRAICYQVGSGLHHMSADAGPFPDEHDALRFPGFGFAAQGSHSLVGARSRVAVCTTSRSTF